MKYILIMIVFSVNVKAQNNLQFDKRNIQCEYKWISYQIDKDSTNIFGFIYIDSQEGLTLNYEGKFKIETNGKFSRIDSKTINKVGIMKVRLQLNRTAVAEILDSKFNELNIEKTPSWLKTYKTDQNSVDRLYRWGYI